jgi:hypothetical protein
LPAKDRHADRILYQQVPGSEPHFYSPRDPRNRIFGRDCVPVCTTAKDDKSEEKRTRYILKAGAGEIVRCFMAALLTRPLALGKTIRHAVKMGVHSDRRILRHLAYVAEAAVLAHWCRRDGIQHIHAHFGTNAAAIAMFAWQLSGISYSFTAHGPEEFEKASLLLLDVKLENAAFAVCVSSFGRSQFMRWSRSDQWPKMAVVHCGLRCLVKLFPLFLKTANVIVSWRERGLVQEKNCR